MKQSWAKVRNSIRAIGVFGTLLRAAHYSRFAIGRMRRASLTRKLLDTPSIEQRFTRIYETNYWGSSESASGAGSTLAYTQRLRAELPALFERFRIQSVLDAPCGDFAWMRHVLPNCSVRYVGGDIVAPLIEKLNRESSGPRIEFVHMDITSSTFPSVDLWFCRDCLFHLSYEHIRSALRSFVASDIPYILTTSHQNPNGIFINTDIKTGEFRRIDLFSAPFNFPKDTLASIDDWREPEPERQMHLWTRQQVQTVLASWKSDEPA